MQKVLYFSLLLGQLQTRKGGTKEITVKEAVSNVEKDNVINAASATIGEAVTTGVTITVAASPADPVDGVVGIVAGVGASMVADNVMRNKIQK